MCFAALAPSLQDHEIALSKLVRVIRHFSAAALLFPLQFLGVADSSLFANLLRSTAEICTVRDPVHVTIMMGRCGWLWCAANLFARPSRPSVWPLEVHHDRVVRNPVPLPVTVGTANQLPKCGMFHLGWFCLFSLKCGSPTVGPSWYDT